MGNETVIYKMNYSQYIKYLICTRTVHTRFPIHNFYHLFVLAFLSRKTEKSPDLSGDLSYRHHSALCYIDLPARDYYTPRVLPLGGIVIEIQTIFRLRLTGNPQLLHIPSVIGSPHRGQFIISPFPALADSPVY